MPVRKVKKLVKKIAYAGIILALLGLAAGGLVVAYFVRDLPDPSQIGERQIAESTKIYDRTGEIVLYEIHGEEKRTIIPLEEIPDYAKFATIAIEDNDFYSHGGISIRGILRAVFIDLRFKNLSQGGSSITQQLIKNSFLGKERTFTRKIKEAILAVMLEQKYGKDDILEFYLNQIPYGSNAYGIQAAARTFFGKDAKDLTHAESALLAALPKAPTYYSPYGSHTEELNARKNYILDRMAELGYLSEKDAHDARIEKLNFLSPVQNIRAPHFVMMVREYLNERYGEDAIEAGGLRVVTTLDWELQEIAEDVISKGAERNERLIKAKNAALTAVNPKTGEIVALVGSRNYFDVDQEGNFNVSTAKRQPGSAFKPFVYAAAFKKGFRPETILFDVPTEFNPQCSSGATSTVISDRQLRQGEKPAEYEKCYHPENYDDTFRGPVSLRKALAQSINVPSVKLLYLTGISDSIQLAKDLGITTLTEPERYGLSLVLGGAEVRLTELVNAYGVFANDGIMNPLTFILEIRKGNEVLEEKKDESRPVLDTNIARMITDVLSDNDARIGVFQPHSSLYFPDRNVAAKTGTTQEYRDAWTIGYTPSLAAGVWVGNNDNTSIQQKGSGVLAAAPIWHDFMASATAKTLPEEFIRPEYHFEEKPIIRGLWQGDQIVKLDRISKKRASTSTPQEFIEEIAVGDPHSILYWIDKSNPTGEKPEYPERDQQYKNWEWAFQNWFSSSDLSVMRPETVSTEFDDVHTESNKPTITVISFQEDASSTAIIVSVSSRFFIRELDVFSDSELVHGVTFPKKDAPIGFTISKSYSEGQKQKITVKAYDDVGNFNEITLE